MRSCTSLRGSAVALLLALAACDTPTTIPAPGDEGAARFTICSTSGECGPVKEPPPDTTTTPPGAASYEYASIARLYVGQLNQQNEIELRTYSRAKAWVATTSLEARFYMGPRCNSSLTQIKMEQKSANGTPVTVESIHRLYRWPNEPYEAKVSGYHTFVPVPGATGGGSHYSTDEICR